MNSTAETLLKNFLEDRENLDVYGNSLLIFHKDKEIFRHYTGEAEKDTLFRIFSMSKVVTVTGALQLLEMGKYTLDEPVEKYLPEFAGMTVWDEEKQEAVPAKNIMKIRNLFSMSAGIAYGGNDCETARRVAKMTAEMEEKYPGRSYTTREYVAKLGEIPLAFEPGTHWRYSLCHDVLGALIEVWSGQTFGEYLKEHIFDPLGMEHTFFRCPPELTDKIARAKGGNRDDSSYGPDARYESGGGGLLSTLDDYMRFANTLTRGGTSEDGVRILGRKTIDLMRMDELNDDQKKDFNWDYIHGYSYGLGVRTMLSPVKAGIPGSVGEFGWCGVLGTWVLMDPSEELTVVYMHQRTPNLEKYVQEHLREMIYGMLI